MAQPDVLVLTHDAADYLPLLKPISGEARVAAATSVAAAVKSYDGQAVVLGEPDLVAAALSHMPSVRWVQSTWAGVTPLLGSGRKDLLLTGIKNVFGRQMSEYVFAYLLAREVKVLERLDRQSNGEWWDRPSGMLQGKTLGLMGTGSIGAEIARRAKSFGMEVIGFSRTGNPVRPFDSVFGGDQFAQFLPRADYLVAVLPDTPATRHLLDEDAFSLMKESCYLVNVGRGSLIDEEALARSLLDGKLAGAVLDVFESEPLSRDSPLWHAPRLMLTAHIAAISRPCDIAEIFIGNYRKYCNGDSLDYLVDLDRGY